VIPEDALNHWRQAIDRGAKLEEEWNQLFAAYKEKYPEEARTLDRMHEAELPEGGIKFYLPTSQRTKPMPPVTTRAKSSML
jgi:transketolase